MNLRGIGFLVASFVQAGLYAQAPIIHWQRLLGGSLSDQGRCLLALPDGGLVGLALIQSDDGDITGFHPGGDYPFDGWIFKNSSEGQLEWQIAVGGNDADNLYELIPTSDGGFIGFGLTFSTDVGGTGTHGDADLYVVKVTGSGQFEWERALGGSAQEWYGSGSQWSWPGGRIIETNDGGILLVGQTRSNDGDVSGFHPDLLGMDTWVVKLSSTGALLWQKCLGGTLGDQPEAVVEMASGDLAILNTTNSTDGDVTDQHGDKDLWVVLLSATGDLLWEHALGGTGQDEGYGLALTADNGLLVCGSTGSNDGTVEDPHYTLGYNDGWVLKLTAAGAIEWQRCIGGYAAEWATHLHPYADGSSLIVLRSTSTDGDFTGMAAHKITKAVKLDPDGEVVWATGAGNGYGYEFLSPIFGPTGDLTVLHNVETPGGDLTQFHGQSDAWLVHFTANGTFDWERCLGGSLGDWGWTATGMPDGRIAFNGYSDSNDGDLAETDPGHPNIWVVVLGDASTSVQDIEGPAPLVRQDPLTHEVSITFSGNGTYELSLLDAMGRLLEQRTVHAPEASFHLRHPSGVYHLVLRHAGTLHRAKLMVE